MKILQEIIDYKKAYANIVNTSVKYIKDNGIKSLVLGISGGIDSTLVALIARDVCDETGIKLIGRNIPIKPKMFCESEAIIGWESNYTAISLGKDLCDDFEVTDLSPEFNILWETIKDPEPHETLTDYKIRRGNVMARMRMICLYDLAQKNRGMVLSTDNLTEYFLGFWTLHGDVGDYGMVQQLWKTEVYKMTEWLYETKYKSLCVGVDIMDSIGRNPTDGLGISNGDLEQLEADSYEEVDNILKEYLKIDNPIYNGERCHQLSVIRRHLRSRHKRLNPINIEREKILK